jgi:glucuronokinase
LAARIVECHAFARAGLLGNPSDGYFGRALSVVLRNFRATVALEESSGLRIEPDAPDGGAPLVRAAINTFAEHCARHGIDLPSRNFTARVRSSIPRQVGLAGSSAIVTATLRALMELHVVDIAREEQANLVLRAETEELGITAGLQDRVAQVYEGLTYMDFSRDLMDRTGHGAYESLDPGLLPPLFVAYHPQSAKVSGQVLNDLKRRWERGDPEVRETLERIAGLAASGRDALLRGDAERFAALMNENFDRRRRVMCVDERDVGLVATVGVFRDDAMKRRLAERLGALGAQVIEAETA